MPGLYDSHRHQWNHRVLGALLADERYQPRYYVDVGTFEDAIEFGQAEMDAVGAYEVSLKYLRRPSCRLLIPFYLRHARSNAELQGLNDVVYAYYDNTRD